MGDYNTRAKKMWKHIYANLPESYLQGAWVLDLGCGHGDLLNYCAKAGAHTVIAVDQDVELIQELMPRLTKAGARDLLAYSESILDFTRQWEGGRVELGICTSVLPYLPESDQNEIVRWMKNKCKYVVLEYQYRGDGPGERFLGPGDFSLWLENLGFGWVKAIGHTVAVKDKKYRRDLWLCQK